MARLSADMRRREAVRIGDTIAWHMVTGGVTKKRVAEYLGCSLPTVYAKFKDARLWTVDDLFSLCNLFNCDIVSLISEKEKKHD